MVQSACERMRRSRVGSGVKLALLQKRAPNPLTESAFRVCVQVERAGGGGNGAVVGCLCACVHLHAHV